MKPQPSRDGVALYHVVAVNEGFDKAALHLLQLIRRAQQEYPGQKRTLHLDIEGHRNATGGFDQDMLELQSKFMTEFLIRFLSRVLLPLATLQNPQPQKNEIPDELTVISVDRKPGEGPPDKPPGQRP